jgi:predicted metal-dependent HD superfamily phosphohydrolase
VFFHDIIYEPTRSDNEERSVDIWKEFATSSCSVDMTQAALIERYILATKSHSIVDGQSMPYDTDLHFFLDIDLSVLAWPPSQYDVYAQQIRQEYQHIPDDAYKAGRTKVLMSLKGERVYSSPSFQEQWEERARINLSREIASLEHASAK